jgi:hypothetical protein
MDLVHKPGSCLYGLLLGICTCYAFLTFLMFWGAVAFGGGFNLRSVIVFAMLSLIAVSLLVATIGTFTVRMLFSRIAAWSSVAFLSYILLFLYGLITHGDISSKLDLLTHGVLAFTITFGVLCLSWLRIRQNNRL